MHRARSVGGHNCVNPQSFFSPLRELRGQASPCRKGVCLDRPGSFRKRQANRLCPLAVIWGKIDELWVQAGFSAKRVQPERPVRFIIGEFHLIEHNQCRLVLVRRLAKELLHRRIVIFLLRQDCDEHIGSLPDRIRALPIHRCVAVNIRGIENHQIRRNRFIRSPEQTVLGMVCQRLIAVAPGTQCECGKQRVQIVMS